MSSKYSKFDVVYRELHVLISSGFFNMPCYASCYFNSVFTIKHIFLVLKVLNY